MLHGPGLVRRLVLREGVGTVSSSGEPCLCGDPYCGACFPQPGPRVHVIVDGWAGRYAIHGWRTGETPKRTRFMVRDDGKMPGKRTVRAGDTVLVPTHHVRAGWPETVKT